ncbi:MAG: STN domain-containing protein [Pirellulales bacterium]|nr:STN domain-containing protein [Pirellulales bacterium]
MSCARQLCCLLGLLVLCLVLTHGAIVSAQDSVHATIAINSPEESAAYARIQAALASPAELNFVETPLSDVFAYLSDRHGIPVKTDQPALDDQGVSDEVAVTMSVEGVSLRSALRLILAPLNLTFVIEDEVLLVTTEDKAQEYRLVRVYPISDLLTENEDGQTDETCLVDAITSTISPTAWDVAGGPSSIMFFHGALIVAAQGDVHEKIEQLLSALRKVPH